MIRENRGVIFSSNGRTRSRKSFNTGSSEAKSKSNTVQQFGRSQGKSPVFGDRARSARR